MPTGFLGAHCQPEHVIADRLPADTYRQAHRIHAESELHPEHTPLASFHFLVQPPFFKLATVPANSNTSGALVVCEFDRHALLPRDRSAAVFSTMV